MHSTTANQIENIKNNGYELDFSLVFTHAIENYKKIALYAGLILLVFTIIAVFLFLGIYAAIYGISSLSGNLIQEVSQLKLTGLALVGSVVAQILVSSLLSPIGAGYYKMADCAENNEEFNVSTMFSYYKSEYFAPIFIATLIITSFTLTIATLLEQVGMVAVTSFFSMAISFITFLTIPLIIFGDLKAIDAIKGSFIIISKQPLVLIGLIVTAFLGSLLGIFAFCLGIFFTIPFNYSMTYAIYKAIITKNIIDPIDTIGTEEEVI